MDAHLRIKLPPGCLLRVGAACGLRLRWAHMGAGYDPLVRASAQERVVWKWSMKARPSGAVTKVIR